MTAPTDKMLVYDGNCPLCEWYTGVFAEHDILKPESRRTFATFSTGELHTMMEFPRAKHEVPLVDLNGGPTLYGVDALAYLLGQRFPLLRRLMRFRAVHACARVLYAFVSYNRRFIAASRPAACSVDYTPDFNLTYRLLLVALAVVLTSVVSLPFAFAVPASIPSGLLFAGASTPLFIAALVLLFSRNHFWDYISHCAVVVVLGSLLPGAGGIAASAFHIPAVWFAAAGVSTLLTTWLLDIRVQRMGMSRAWSALWGGLLAGCLAGAVVIAQ